VRGVTPLAVADFGLGLPRRSPSWHPQVEAVLVLSPLVLVHPEWNQLDGSDEGGEALAD
jgi:hypothetical protein